MEKTRDLLIARLVVERGLVSRVVLEDCLRLQGQVAALGLTVSLPFVLQNKGLLNAAQGAELEQAAADLALRGTQVGTVLDGDSALGEGRAPTARPEGAGPTLDARATGPIQRSATGDGAVYRSELRGSFAGVAAKVQAGEAAALGPYNLLRELGRGAMGIVYEARRAGENRPVALKVVSTDLLGSRALARFHREADTVSRLHHPNIVQVYETGEVEGVPYLAMEMIAGRSLERVAHVERLPWLRAVRIFEQAADAIHYAHTQGIIHRDLKPGNLMLGAGDRVIITDFGLARDLSGVTLTATGQIMGTPMYMPPEQAEGKVDELDARSDVYALGASLYEILAGRPLFAGDSVATILHKVLGEEPRALRGVAPEVPRELEWIVQKSVRKERERRYATAAELRDDLRRVREGQKPSARPTTFLFRTLRTARRNRGATAVVLAAGLTVVVGGAAWWRQATREQARAEHLRGAEAQVRAGNLEEGLRLLEELVRQDPEDSAGTLARGRVLARLGRPADALASLSQATTAAPESAECWAERGAVERRLGRIDEALTHLDRALHVQASFALARVERGELRVERGDVGGARGDFAAVRDGQAPDELRMRAECGLGRLELAAGRFADARTGFERARDLMPDAPEPHLGLMACHLAVRNFEAADECVRRAVERDPGNPQPQLHRARLLVRWGDLDAARKAVDEAARIAPALAEAEFLRALIGDSAQAGEALDRCLTLDPQHADARAWRAVRRMDAGDLDGAERDLAATAPRWLHARLAWRRGTAPSSTVDAESRLLAARAAAERGDLPGAVRTLQSDAGLPDATSGAVGLGAMLQEDATALYAHAGRDVAEPEPGSLVKALRRVIVLCERATALCPERAQAHVLQARAWIELGRFREGMAALDRAVAAQPALPEARGWRGFFRVMLSAFVNYSGAAEDLDLAVMLAPTDPRWWLARAELRVALRDRAGAVADLAEVTRLAPDLAGARWLSLQMQRPGGGPEVLNAYLQDWRRLKGDRAWSRTLERAANSAMELGNYVDAPMLYELALSEDPGNGDAVLGFGSWVQQSGDVMTGMYLQFRAGEIHPDFALKTYFRMAPMMRRLAGNGQFNQNMLALMMAGVPEGAIRDVMIGFTYFSLRKPEVALRHFEAAMQKEPESMVAACFKGAAMCLTGKGAEARPLVQAALEGNPQAAMPLYFMAGLEAAAGHEAEALSYLERCLAFGFAGASETIREEAFFQGMRENDEFRKLLAK